MLVAAYDRGMAFKYGNMRNPSSRPPNNGGAEHFFQLLVSALHTAQLIAAYILSRFEAL